MYFIRATLVLITLTSNTFKYSLITPCYLCDVWSLHLSYLDLEKIYSPPGRLLRLGLGTLSSLVHDGWDSIHSIASPAFSWHAAGGGWLVSAIRKVKQMIRHARLVLLGDVDSADSNVLCLLPAPIHTWKLLLSKEFVTWNNIPSASCRQATIYLMHMSSGDNQKFSAYNDLNVICKIGLYWC